MRSGRHLKRFGTEVRTTFGAGLLAAAREARRRPELERGRGGGARPRTQFSVLKETENKAYWDLQSITELSRNSKATSPV